MGAIRNRQKAASCAYTKNILGCQKEFFADPTHLSIAELRADLISDKNL